MVVELLNDQATLSVDTGFKYDLLSPIMLFIILKPSNTNCILRWKGKINIEKTPEIQKTIGHPQTIKIYLFFNIN